VLLLPGLERGMGSTHGPSLPCPLQNGFVPGALNLPVSSLRKRMSEVPEGKKLYVYCQVGGWVGGSWQAG